MLRGPSSPESFDIVPKTMTITTGKKNLAQISKVLAQITSGLEFDDDKPSYVPINDFVRKAIQQMTAWYYEGIFIYTFSPPVLRPLFQLQTFPMRRLSSMHTNLWTPRFNPNQYIFHLMRSTISIPCLCNIRTSWFVRTYSAAIFWSLIVFLGT